MIENKKTNKRSSFLSSLSLAWQMGYTIVVPLVIFAMAGRLLDKKLDSSPFLLLLGVFLAMISSGLLVFRKTREILREATKEDK